MRRAVLALLVCACLVPVAAQRRAGPPTFEPGDTEGLVVSPNPRKRERRLLLEFAVGVLPAAPAEGAQP